MREWTECGPRGSRAKGVAGGRKEATASVERKKQPGAGRREFSSQLWPQEPSVSRGGGKATPAGSPTPFDPSLALPAPQEAGIPVPPGGFGRSQGCLSTNAGRETPRTLMPPPVSSVGPEGRGLGSRPSCAEWRPARGRGWPRPATSSSSPSPPREHSRVSLPPLPLPRAPRAGGSRRPGDGRVIINPRPEIPPEGPGRAAGARGGGAGSEPGRPPAPPPPFSSEPAPRIMETGPPADPLAPLRIPASGGGLGESCAAPSGQRLGALPVPPERGPAPPLHSKWGASSQC